MKINRAAEIGHCAHSLQLLNRMLFSNISSRYSVSQCVDHLSGLHALFFTDDALHRDQT